MLQLFIIKVNGHVIGIPVHENDLKLTKGILAIECNLMDTT